MDMSNGSRPEKTSTRGMGGGSDSSKRGILPRVADLKWIDQFPYYPAYRYHPYRSCCGTAATVFMVAILLLRVVSALVDYIDRPPIVTEAREQFPRDPPQQYALPRVGVQFRQNGWRPFADPRYIQIIFEQGVISRAGNVPYAELGTKD